MEILLSYNNAERLSRNDLIFRRFISLPSEPDLGIKNHQDCDQVPKNPTFYFTYIWFKSK